MNIKNIKNIKMMDFLKMLLILTIIFGILKFKSIDLNFSSIDNKNTIIISGKAEKKVAPDTARIYFSVNEYKKDQKEAANIINKKTKRIIEVVRNSGVEEKDIKTQNYSIAPQYDWNKGNRIFRNYKASQSVEIIVRDLENIPKVLAKIVEEKVDNINGPNMFIDNLEDIQDSLRKEAIENAKQKARDLAWELGISLDNIVSFSEDNNYIQPSFYRSESVSSDFSKSKSITRPKINQGEEKITKSVNITFKIKN